MEGQFDSSGIRMIATTQLRQNQASVLTLGKATGITVIRLGVTDNYFQVQFLVVELPLLYQEFVRLELLVKLYLPLELR